MWHRWVTVTDSTEWRRDLWREWRQRLYVAAFVAFWVGFFGAMAGTLVYLAFVSDDGDPPPTANGGAYLFGFALLMSVTSGTAFLVAVIIVERRHSTSAGETLALARLLLTTATVARASIPPMFAALFIVGILLTGDGASAAGASTAVAVLCLLLSAVLLVPTLVTPQRHVAFSLIASLYAVTALYVGWYLVLPAVIFFAYAVLMVASVVMALRARVRQTASPP